MNVEATAENRPALFADQHRRAPIRTWRETHEDQGRVQIFIVFLQEFLVVFFRHFLVVLIELSLIILFSVHVLPLAAGGA